MTHPHIAHMKKALGNRQQYHTELKLLAEQLERERQQQLAALTEQQQQDTAQQQ